LIEPVIGAMLAFIGIGPNISDEAMQFRRSAFVGTAKGSRSKKV
jgi:hypothetical protein